MIGKVEVTGFLESSVPLVAVFAIRGPRYVSEVVFHVISNPLLPLDIVQQLQAIITDDHVHEPALALESGDGSLQGLDCGRYDFDERFLQDELLGLGRQRTL